MYWFHFDSVFSTRSEKTTSVIYLIVAFRRSHFDSPCNFFKNGKRIKGKRVYFHNKRRFSIVFDFVFFFFYSNPVKSNRKDLKLSQKKNNITTF